MADRRYDDDIDNDDFSDSDLISEGASDDEQQERKEAHPYHMRGQSPPQDTDKSTACAFAYHSRWHRKVLVVLALIAIGLVWAMRNQNPTVQGWVSNATTDTESWISWAKSSSGERFLLILIGLVVLDVGVDWAFGVWTKNHVHGY